MNSSPSALVVTSAGAPAAVVTPVLAGLEVSGLDVHAMDVGRAGSRDEGTVGRFVRAIAGEFAERKLERVFVERPMDVVIGFEPATVASLVALRDASSRPPAVVAVLGGLAPEPGWAGSDADRYLVVDDDAAVALADRGLEGQRIMPVGVVAPFGFAQAAKVARTKLRARFKIAGDDPVVLIRVEGLGYELTQQIALQLSLLGAPANYLFDAGTDTEAASALRRQVPTLELKAKLFGITKEAPSYWRAADVVVARPTQDAVSRALIRGCKFVSLLGDEKSGERLATAVTDRSFGVTASSPLLLSSALESIVGSKKRIPLEGVDGAGNIADIAYVVARDRDAVIADSRGAARERTRSRVEQASAYAEVSAKASSAPGELEDLSGGAAMPDIEPVGVDEISDLRQEIRARMTQVQRVVADTQSQAGRLDAKATKAKARGDEEVANEARKAADAERARMHRSLAELAELTRELETLGKAEASARPARTASSTAGATSTRPRPRSQRGGGTSTRAPRQNVDELLSELKRDAGAEPGKSKPRSAAPRGAKKRKRRGEKGSSVDDELAALKRKMQNQKRRK